VNPGDVTLPGWVSAYLGQSVTEAFPTAPGKCGGHFELVSERFVGAKQGIKLLGWGWDVSGSRVFKKVVVTDGAGVIVGGSESAMQRPDLVGTEADSVKDPSAGFSATATVTSGPARLYGLDEGKKSACELDSFSAG
jgi:hypothetical protein